MKFIVFLLSWFLPFVAMACAVCLGNNEDNANAFLVATVLLTLLPVAVILGSIRWAQRKIAARDGAESPGAQVPARNPENPPSLEPTASRTFPG